MRRKFYEETWFALLICGVFLFAAVIFIFGSMNEDEVAENNSVYEEDFHDDRLKLQENNSPKNSNSKPTQPKLKKIEDDSIFFGNNNKTEDARQVVNIFMQAYLEKNQQVLADYAYYEGRLYSSDTMSKFLNISQDIFDLLNQLGAIGGYNAEWKTKIKKVSSDTCQATITLNIVGEKLEIAPVAVVNVDGDWYVDLESFSTAVAVAFSNASMQ